MQRLQRWWNLSKRLTNTLVGLIFCCCVQKYLGKGFCFPGRPRRDLQEIIVSSKAVTEVLDMKYRSEFKHGFTNRGCLQCAILKALHGFQKKRAHKSRDMQFFLQNGILKIFRMFKNNMNSPEQPAELTQKQPIVTKTPHS